MALRFFSPRSLRCWDGPAAGRVLSRAARHVRSSAAKKPSPGAAPPCGSGGCRAAGAALLFAGGVGLGAAWQARGHCLPVPAVVAAAEARQVESGGEYEEFDWRLGVVLAGCSFEAYSEPEPRSLPDCSASGVSQYYCDKEFLQRKMAGLLEVTVEGAKGLPALDVLPINSSDPYARIAVGDCVATTKTIMHTLDPEWGETFWLYVRDPGQQELSLRLFDYDMGKEDDYMGEASVALQPLCDGQQHKLTLEISGEAHSSGSVRVAARFHPFDGSSEGGLLAQAAAGAQLGTSPVAGAPAAIPLQDGWRELHDLAGVAASMLFRPVAYLENASTGTQAWVYCQPEERRLCVAFRGTEEGKWKDVLTDLAMSAAPLCPKAVAEAPSHAALAEVSQPEQQPGTLRQVMARVEEACEEVAALREQQLQLQQQQEQQEEAEQKEEERVSATSLAAGKEEEYAEGQEGQVGEPAADSEGEQQPEQHQVMAAAAATVQQVATAVATVQQVAEDVSEVLSRVRQALEAAEQLRQQEGGAELASEEIWCHHGFLSAYDSIRPQLLALVDRVMEGETEPWTLCITGHSLGGALATLHAYDCALRSWSCPPPRIVMVNFGSPRVGSRAFARHFNQLVPSAWRVANSNDAVASVPRLMGYCHVGHAVRLQPGGEAVVERDTSEALGEGVALPEVLPVVQASLAAKVPELAAGALASVGLEVVAAAAGVSVSSLSSSSSDSEGEPSDGPSLAGSEPSSSSNEEAGEVQEGVLRLQDVGSLWEQERAAWAALLGGTALNDHMEEPYLLAMRQYIEALQREQQSGQHAAIDKGSHRQQPSWQHGAQQPAASAPPPLQEDEQPHQGGREREGAPQ